MQYWYKIHRWISLLCVVFFLLLCITGLPLLFKMEIHDYNMVQENMQHASLNYSSVWQHVEDGENTILTNYPNKVVKAISVQPDDGRILYRIQDKDSKKIVDARLSMGGEQVAYYPDDNTLQNWHREVVKSPFVAKFMHIMHLLHMYMGLGKGGMVFLGFMCLLSFVSVISGIFIYGPFMKKTRFAEISHTSSAAGWFGWHKFLGIATAAWAALLCFSGVMIVVFSLGYGSYISNVKAAASQNMSPQINAEHVSLPEAISFINQQFNKKYILSIDMPDKRLNRSRYVFYLTPAQDRPTEFMGQLVFVGADGQGSMQYYTEPLPAYLSFAAASLDLHIHNHDTITLKIIWAVLDIIIIVVIVTGFVGWWKRSANVKRNNSNGYFPVEALPAKSIWQIPVLVFVLSVAGMVFPLYGTNGELVGAAMLFVAIIICLWYWYKRK